MADLTTLTDDELEAGLRARLAGSVAPDRSAVRGVLAGLRKPLDNLAGWAASTGPGKAIDRFGQSLGLPSTTAANAASAFDRASNTRKGFQTVGNIAGTLPTLALPGGVLAQGAASGALLSDAKGLQGVATDAAIGGVGSVIGDRALRAVGGAIAPRLRDPVKALLARKIPLTPGQIVGGGAQKFEDVMTSIPGIGSLIDARRTEGVAAFNKAAFNEALKPIGVSLPEGVSGHGAIRFLKDTFKDAYDTVLGGMNVADDAEFGAAIKGLRGAATTVPGGIAKTYDAFIKNNVAPYFSNGQMTGRTFKDVDRQLRDQARKYAQGSGAEKAYGELIDATRLELRNAAARHSDPRLVSALGRVDDAYGNYIPLRDAASKTADGSFLPGGLETSVRVADRSVGKGAKAAGEARLQTLSGAARDVLPAKIGTSGTAERVFAGGLTAAGGGLGAWAIDPSILTAPLAAAALYSKPGAKAAQWAMMRGQGKVPQAIRRGMLGMNRFTPVVAPPFFLEKPER